MRRILAYLILTAGASFSASAQLCFDFPQPKPFFQHPDTVSMVFMGDVMMHKDQITDALQSDGTYSFSTYFKEIGPLISDADLAVANMEFTLGGTPYTGYPCFSAPDAYSDYAADCGIDIFLTANNHILDRGKAGIERTLAIYDRMEEERGIKYTGCAADEASAEVRNPLIVAVKGFRVALVNFTYGTNTSLSSEWPSVFRTDTARIGKALRKAREADVDFIIALPHWGIEYDLTSSAAQRKLARWLVRNGCDAVIGAHPHVVQNMETLQGTDGKAVPVAYSMGNLVSNMSAPNTRIGMMLRLRVVTGRTGERTVEAEPVLTWCTRPGTLTGSYCTIPVKEYVGRRDLWISPYDYDNMIENYRRVKAITNIED